MEPVQCDPTDLGHVELVKSDGGFVSLTGQHAQNSSPETSQEAEKMAQMDLSNDLECCDTIVPNFFLGGFIPGFSKKQTPGLSQCICREWIPFTEDMYGFSLNLELWTAHLSVCNYAIAKGIKSLEEMINSWPDDPLLKRLKLRISLTMKQFEDRERLKLRSSSIMKQIEDSELSHDTAENKLKIKLNAIAPPNCNVTHESLGEPAMAETSIRRESVAEPPTVPARRRRVRGPNKSEPERIEAFRSDPQVKDVEPYRVLCATCNSWIKLRNNSRYCWIPWNCHKASCGVGRAKPRKKRKVTKSASPRVTQQPSTCDVDDAECSKDTPALLDFEMKGDPAVSPPDVHSSLQLRNVYITSSPALHPEASDGEVVSYKLRKELKISNAKELRRQREIDAETRRTALESDPFADSVEPNRLMCGLCQKWVKLRLNSSYCAAPWQSHIQRCITRAFELEPEGDWKLKIEESAFLSPEFINALTLKLSKTTGERGIDEEMGKDDLQPSNELQLDRQQSDGFCAKASSNKEHQTGGIIKRKRGRPPKHVQKRRPSPTLTDVSYESEEA